MKKYLKYCELDEIILNDIWMPMSDKVWDIVGDMIYEDAKYKDFSGDVDEIIFFVSNAVENGMVAECQYD
jgi:hypothetical protein